MEDWQVSWLGRKTTLSQETEEDEPTLEVKKTTQTSIGRPGKIGKSYSWQTRNPHLYKKREGWQALWLRSQRRIGKLCGYRRNTHLSWKTQEDQHALLRWILASLAAETHASMTRASISVHLTLSHIICITYQQEGKIQCIYTRTHVYVALNPKYIHLTYT